MQWTLAAFLAILPVFISSTPVTTRIGAKIPLSRRIPFINNGVVNASALQAHVSQVQAKILRGFDNFKKNTGAAHPSDRRTLVERDVGIIPLSPDNEQLWYGTITVGTPANNFTVDFDTGSSDLFLPSTLCYANCQGHRRYNPFTSQTAVALHEPFFISFGDGSSVQGGLFTDTVTVAGLTATDQTLADALQYSTSFARDQFPPDGLMGMGFPQISNSGSNPVFQTLINQGRTTEPVFSFYLADSGSELVLGGINNDIFTGPFTRVSVTVEGYWQVNLDAVQVGGSTIVSGLSSIIDTGTTLIVGDTQSVQEFYDAIPGSQDASRSIAPGTFTVPCDSVINVSLTFGGRDFLIPDNIFIQAPVSEGSPDCVGGVIAINGQDFWVVGDVFLRAVYTLFDVGNAQVGFATLA